MTVQEPSVREMLGVYGNASSDASYQKWVEMKELDGGVHIASGSFGSVLSVSQARRLAQQLYRLARRIEKRQEGLAPDA